jgi:hypothetical protein
MGLLRSHIAGHRGLSVLDSLGILLWALGSYKHEDALYDKHRP